MILKSPVTLVVSPLQDWGGSHMVPSAGCGRSPWSECHFPVLSSGNEPTSLMGKEPWAESTVLSAGSSPDGSPGVQALPLPDHMPLGSPFPSSHSDSPPVRWVEEAISV